MTILPQPSHNDDRRANRLFQIMPARVRNDVYERMVREAMRRYLPGRYLSDYMPDWVGGWELHWKDRSDESSITKLFCDGLEAAGEIDEHVIGSSEWDAEAVFRILGHVEVSSSPFTRPFEEEAICSYLDTWRENIVRACEVVERRMAKTVGEALLQEVDPPNDVDEWVDYALTIDGCSISDELDDHAPGRFNHEFDLDPSKSDRDCEVSTFSLRLGLYCKLRFLQSQHNGELFELDDQLLQDIQPVLDLIRRRRRETSAEQEIIECLFDVIQSSGKFKPEVSHDDPCQIVVRGNFYRITSFHDCYLTICLRDGWLSAHANETRTPEEFDGMVPNSLPETPGRTSLELGAVQVKEAYSLPRFSKMLRKAGLLLPKDWWV